MILRAGILLEFPFFYYTNGENIYLRIIVQFEDYLGMKAKRTTWIFEKDVDRG